jgi:hypothetical protein
MLTSALAAAVVLSAAPAQASFPQDPPNDPDYAAAESNCAAESVNDEQHYLFSFPSACTPLAAPPDGAAGMSVDRVWREVTPGRPDVTIAYIEGGINWQLANARDLVNQVFVNDGELPAPTTPKDDGRLNIEDFADTPDHNRNGFPDPEDLIVRFSDGRDDDGNGYTDDISGWDFYNDQNDPATADDKYPHANNQLRKAAAQADNGLLGTGVCPGCTIVPVKAGAEALDRSDDLAQAWLYAADMGASVIVSVTAPLGYSSFMDQAVGDIWRRGVVMVEASNDFDSTDHQGGHFHEFVVPGNGMLTNSVGVEGPPANVATTSFIARSGKTSWGTKNFVTVSTQEGSTSQSTPIHGGLYALLASVGKVAQQRGRPALDGRELLQVVRSTATDIDDPGTNWPSHKGFDLQYGYGRPHAQRAAAAILAGDVPPVGWIDSPEWYTQIDPTREKTVTVRGHVEAKRSPSYRWRLQVAPGAEPGEADFADVGSGAGAKPFDGTLGSFSTSRLPESFWAKAFALSKTKTLETNEQYTVTLRLQVTDATGRVGEDRRSIAVHHDPSQRRGFPLEIGPGGEAQPQLVDLQGTGRLAAVLGDSDGRVHAIDLVSAKELPGWPVTTRPVRVTRSHPAVEPGHEPVVANAAVGDLDGDGRLSVVVTSTSGRTYVWDARGRRRSGFPKVMDRDVAVTPVPRPRRPYRRDRVRGAFAPPVLVDLTRDGLPEIVQAGWDGYLHAWKRDGTDAPGWPVTPKITAAPPGGYARIDDLKLNVPPVVAQLDADPEPELVVRTQQADTLGPEIQPLGRIWTAAYNHDGTMVPGWPIRQNSLIMFYGSAQEFITEGANIPAAADVDGDGRDEVAISPIFSATSAVGGDGRPEVDYGAVDAAVGTVLAGGDVSGSLPADVPVSFTTSGAYGRFGGSLRYLEPGSNAASIAGALLVTGSGLPIVNTMRAWDAASGRGVSGFPATAQGLDFLGAPTIADVTGDGEPEVLQGGDTSALHAFTTTGAQAPAFPKFMQGWSLYAPAVGDIEGDGKLDVVLATREGYLNAWASDGDARRGNSEWWSFRHDERNTSRYGTDTRPPSPLSGVALRGTRASFAAGGDDWHAGEAARYEVRTYRSIFSDERPSTTLRPTAAGPLRVPGRTRRIEVTAIDDAGNRSTPVSVPRARARPCASRRVVVLRLPRGARRVRLGARHLRITRAAGHRVARVDLRRLPRGTYRVTVRDRSGRLIATRTFKTCARRRR